MLQSFFKRFFVPCLSTFAVIALPISAHSSQASIEAIKLVWPEVHRDVALKIARRESGLQPSASGCGRTCFGLFQISYPAHRHWLAAIGITSPQQLKDPLTNAKAAYHLFKITGSNWSPWCHSSGFPRSC